MEKERNKEFITRTESLVKPEDITAISFLGDFNRFLPLKTQHKIMVKGSSKIPYMGFIVDPYCFFLSYRIKDVEAAQAMVPPEYEIVPSAIFSDEEKHPLVIVSAFTARTSAFMGMRLEWYIIARHRETGQMAWLISEYQTNTNSHDPKQGFCGYTCDTGLFTTTPHGELLIDIQSKEDPQRFALQCNMKEGKMEDLDRDLWVEGNLTVDYGGKLIAGHSKPFSLIFDPFLMKEAQRIPLKDVNIQANDFLPELIDGAEPLSAALFPYAQHFVINQHQEKELKDEAELEEQINHFLQRKGYKTMAGEDLKKPLFRGMIISSIFNLALITFLVLKLLL